MTATMFATGRILFDPRGRVASLCRAAKRELRVPYPRLSRGEVERSADGALSFETEPGASYDISPIAD